MKSIGERRVGWACVNDICSAVVGGKDFDTKICLVVSCLSAAVAMVKGESFQTSFQRSLRIAHELRPHERKGERAGMYRARKNGLQNVISTTQAGSGRLV